MAIDIAEHELVPEHEILEEDDVTELLKTYNIDKEDLPEMARKDPMARKLQADPGDVIKITRDSPTAGEAQYYRLVVDK